VTRLTAQWQDDAKAFAERDLSGVDYVYLWADGVHLNVRLDEAKLCLLVMVGVRVDGTKELVALTDGYRESTGLWADLLRDCKRRGMRVLSQLPVSDRRGRGGWVGPGLRIAGPNLDEGTCRSDPTAAREQNGSTTTPRTALNGQQQHRTESNSTALTCRACVFPGHRRVASCFTPKRSLVRSQHRPPEFSPLKAPC
jgi:hypothetical protein